MRKEIIDGIKKAVDQGLNITVYRQFDGTYVLCAEDTDGDLSENFGSLESL